MLYKMHLCQEELSEIESAMKEYLMLQDEPSEALQSASEKVGLLKTYVDIHEQVTEILKEQDKAKQAYNDFTFNKPH